MKAVLFYVHDPMCSWCWGFSEVKKQFFSALPDEIKTRRLLGGLAADDEQPMSAELQQYIQQTWRHIEGKIPNVRFNFDFWQKCQPRRSTYPACRAVIAARLQGDQYDEEMTTRIQQAYYQEARNPSDNKTLIDLARDIGLDHQRFSNDLLLDSTQQSLMQEIRLSRQLHADSFPSLVLKIDDSTWPVAIDYLDAQPMLKSVKALL